MSSSKYYNQKTIRDGITFDSKTEAEYYMYLKRQQEKGKVTSFELQPELVLIPTFKHMGKTQRSMKYILDFKVTYSDGSVEYIDVKGFGTNETKNKLKLARYLYQDVRINWISYDPVRAYKTGGWIEYDELNAIKRKEERNSFVAKAKKRNVKKKYQKRTPTKRKVKYPIPKR